MRIRGLILLTLLLSSPFARASKDQRNCNKNDSHRKGVARLLLLCCAFSTLLQADNTLVVSLINDSAMKFVFERSEVEFPNNTLTIEKKVLGPGDTAIITGTTTLEEDLSGVLYFKNNASFWVLDKRQFHVGPPIFSFLSNATSTLISKTPNSQVGAMLLSYVAAKVLIQD